MEEPVYYINDAAIVVHQNIPHALQIRFTLEDIVEILDAMFEYMEETNVASRQEPIVDIPIQVPAYLDEEDMKYAIIGKCARKDIFLSFEEISTILDAEMLYLEQKGLLDDEEGLSIYCN